MSVESICMKLTLLYRRWHYAQMFVLTCTGNSQYPIFDKTSSEVYNQSIGCLLLLFRDNFTLCSVIRISLHLQRIMWLGDDSGIMDWPHWYLFIRHRWVTIVLLEQKRPKVGCGISSTDIFDCKLDRMTEDLALIGEATVGAHKLTVQSCNNTYKHTNHTRKRA